MTLDDIITDIDELSKKVQPGVMPADILSLLAEIHMSLQTWRLELGILNAEALKNE